jgi:hypothetical protein
MNDLINWSGISRRITGGSREGIRPAYIPKKHQQAVLELFKKELPDYIAKLIEEQNKKPED